MAQDNPQREGAARLSSVPTPTARPDLDALPTRVPTPTPRPDRDSFTPATPPSRDGKTEVRGGYRAKTVRVDPKVSFMDDPSFSPLLSAPKPTPLMFSPKKTGPSQSFTPGGSAPSAHVLHPNQEKVDSLSRRFESGNLGPGAVSSGVGDKGGVSYGTYQLSKDEGTVGEFVRSLRDSHPAYHAALSGAKPGTESFNQAWKKLADQDPKGFEQAQREFTTATHYNPARVATQEQTGLDADTRTHTLREVLASTANQHRGNTKDVIARALRGREPSTVSDAELIRDIYAERGREGPNSKLAYFQTSSLGQQKGLRDRFKNEAQAALDMLARELE